MLLNLSLFSIQRSRAEGIQHAKHFLNRDSAEVKGVSYARIAEIVDLVFNSETFTSGLERDSSNKEGHIKHIHDMLSSKLIRRWHWFCSKCAS
jgi:hypothetical protein